MAQALVAAVYTSGGKIALNCEPRRIHIEADRLIGVETKDGDLVRARHFVASGLNPHQTFQELLDQRWLPEEWRKKGRKFSFGVLAQR